MATRNLSEVLNAPPAEDLRSIGVVGPLVSIGIQNDPDVVIFFLDGLPPTSLKAHLLFIAASSLRMPERLPLHPPIQENANKGDQ